MLASTLSGPCATRIEADTTANKLSINLKICTRPYPQHLLAKMSSAIQIRFKIEISSFPIKIYSPAFDDVLPPTLNNSVIYYEAVKGV